MHFDIIYLASRGQKICHHLKHIFKVLEPSWGGVGVGDIICRGIFFWCYPCFWYVVHVTYLWKQKYILTYSGYFLARILHYRGGDGGGDISACSNFINLARYFFNGVNPFVWCVVTYLRTKINLNLYFFSCENITIW